MPFRGKVIPLFFLLYAYVLWHKGGCNVGLKTLLVEGLSEPEFYGDLVYKFRKIIGKTDFPYHFKKIIVRYKKIGMLGC